MSDESRWRVFDYLRKTCEQEQVQTLLILGDMTDKKDEHPASLVNRLVNEITSLRSVVPRIYILRGNHDWLRDGKCFFQFLSKLDGITFVTQTTELNLDDGPSALLLPHTRTPGTDWADFACIDDFHQYVFMHQTYKGALSSNGQALEGDHIPDIFGGVKVYSGDIHVPQIIGPVEYVGSPMHIHFGDTFRGRCVLLDRRNRAVDLFPDLQQKHVIDASSGVTGFYNQLIEKFDAGMQTGDQIKLRIHLDRTEVPEWPRLRREMSEIVTGVGLDLRMVEMVTDKQTTLRVSPKQRSQSIGDAVLAYVDHEKLDGSFLDAALDMVEGK